VNEVKFRWGRNMTKEMKNARENERRKVYRLFLLSLFITIVSLFFLICFVKRQYSFYSLYVFPVSK
jgi:hypothetical protein